MEAAEILREEKKKCFDVLVVLAGLSSAGDLIGFALERPTITSTKKKDWKYRKQNSDRAFILFYICYFDYFIKIQIWVRYSNALSDPCVMLIPAISKPHYAWA